MIDGVIRVWGHRCIYIWSHYELHIYVVSIVVAHRLALCSCAINNIKICGPFGWQMSGVLIESDLLDLVFSDLLLMRLELPEEPIALRLRLRDLVRGWICRLLLDWIHFVILRRNYSVVWIVKTVLELKLRRCTHFYGVLYSLGPGKLPQKQVLLKCYILPGYRPYGFLSFLVLHVF